MTIFIISRLRWRLLRPVTRGLGELLQHKGPWAAHLLTCSLYEHDTLLAKLLPSEHRHEGNVQGNLLGLLLWLLLGVG